MRAVPAHKGRAALFYAHGAILCRVGKQAVVIGAGQGGLSAAIHARLNGWDVLVLEQGDAPGGKAKGISMEGFSLDPGPSIVILTDIYRRVFEAAGRRMEDYLRFSRLDPFSRIYQEGVPGFLDLPADPAACIEVLSRNRPKDREALALLLKKLAISGPLIEKTIFARPVHQPWQLADPRLMRAAMQFDPRADYKQLVDGMFESPLLRAFFYGFPSYNGQTYDSKAAGALMIPYLMITSGVWWPEGGVASIPASFYRLAKELGVEFRFRAKAAGVNAEKGMVQSLSLESGEQVRADAFISNMDRITLGGLLGRPQPKQPSFSYFTLHWGIRRKIEGLDHHTLLVPAKSSQGFEDLYRKRRPPEDLVLYLNSTPAPPGCTCLFAVATVPALEDHLDWTKEAAKLRGQVRRQLDSFGLGFQEEEIIFERMQTPQTFLERDGSWRGSLYGPDEAERLWKLLPFRCRDEELSNLFYAGGTVQPGAGLPMVTLSGKFAADLLPKQ